MPWSPLPSDDAGAPRPIGGAVDRLMRALGAPSSRAARDVFAQWPALVGEEVAAHTRPRSMRGGSLRVEVDDPAWASQLGYLEQELLARLRSGGVEGIERLAFVVVHHKK